MGTICIINFSYILKKATSKEESYKPCTLRCLWKRQLLSFLFFSFGKYHKKTMCKILDVLKKLSRRQHSIFWKPPQFKLYKTQKGELRVLSWKVFYMWKLSQKNIVHNLRRFRGCTSWFKKKLKFKKTFKKMKN